MKKPSAPKFILLLIAGLMWVIVGAFLNRLAYHWLLNEKTFNLIILITSGLILAFLIHFFGFSKIVSKNLKRIAEKPKKPCIFGFMSWKSYLIVIIMMTMGIYLRMSPIPKPYLAIIYIGIGTALILSGSKYFLNLKKV